jgi:hypothetical protein
MKTTKFDGIAVAAVWNPCNGFIRSIDTQARITANSEINASACIRVTQAIETQGFFIHAHVMSGHANRFSNPSGLSKSIELSPRETHITLSCKRSAARPGGKEKACKLASVPSLCMKFKSIFMAVAEKRRLRILPLISRSLSVMLRGNNICTHNDCGR